MRDPCVNLTIYNGLYNCLDSAVLSKVIAKYLGC